MCAQVASCRVVVAFLLMQLSSQAFAQAELAAPDFQRLSEPSLLEQLKLTDEQRIRLAQLQQEQAKSLAIEDLEQRATALTQLESQFQELLTPEQLKIFRSLPGQAKLAFNFRQTQWLDVLDWFARQAGLSLVVNEPPPGTFTYSDTKSYTPVEALDLLNGVLITHGFTLIRRERMLICIDLSQGVPSGMLPRVRMEDLDQYGNFELVQVMFPLGGRPAPGVAEEITPLIGSFGEATPLPQTKQLLVWTTAGKMRAVSAVIASIPEPSKPAQKPPQPPPPKPELKIYSIRNIDAKAAVETLRVLLPGANLTIDERAKQINAFAVPSQQTAIQKLLDQMAAHASGDGEVTLETYPVDHADPDELLKQLQLVLPDVTISFQSEPSRLIAYAAADAHRKLAAALKKLDLSGTSPTERRVGVYTLKTSDPASLTEAIRALYPRIALAADAGTQRLIVVGNDAEQAVVTKLVQQLESDDREPRTVKYYVRPRDAVPAVLNLLKSVAPDAEIQEDAAAERLLVIATDEAHAEITRVLQQLDLSEISRPRKQLRLYAATPKQREQFLLSYKKLAPELEQIEVVEDAPSGELRVVADGKQHQDVEELLKEIKLQFPAAKRQLKFYPADAQLREQFAALRSKLAPELAEVQIVGDALGHGMGVIATEEEHQKLAAVLQELRDVIPASTSLVRVYPVTPAQQKRFLAVLPALQDQLPDVRVIDDAQPTEIAIWASQDQHHQVQTLLQSLRAADGGPTMELVAYPLKAGDPGSVESILSELYPDTKIVADEESRRVMVWTTAEQHEQIRGAIEQLDTPSSAGTRKMAYYQLGEIDVRDALTMFEQLLPKMEFISDRRTNSIIAWGSEQDHQLLAKTVDDFRKQSLNASKTVVSYPCGARDVQDVRRLIDDLVPRARVVDDAAHRSVIVWASPEEHATVRSAITEMTQGRNGQDGELRVYRVDQIDADDLMPMLRATVPAAQVTASADDRQLLVWANDAAHQKIASIVQQVEAGTTLDSQGSLHVYQSRPAILRKVELLLPDFSSEAKVISDDDQRQLVVWATKQGHQRIGLLIDDLEKQIADEPRSVAGYELDNLSVTEARDVITSVAADAQYYETDDARRLLVRASAADHRRIKTALTELQAAKGQQAVLQLRVYSVGDNDPETILSLLDRDLTEGISITSDDRRKSFVVRAAPERHEVFSAALDELLKKLPQIAQKTSRVYRLQHANPTSLQTALAEMMPEINFAIDAETRSLVATALPDEHRLIEQAVNQLDQLSEGGRETKVYRFQYGDVESAREVLQELAPQAVMAIDAVNRSLLVTAGDDDHKRLAATVQQLDVQREDATVARVYPFLVADVAAAQQVLKSLLPNADIAADIPNRILVATATAEDHRKIAATVKEMDTPNDRQPTLQSYSVAQANAEAVFASIRQMYDGNPLVAISFDPENRALFVKAPTQEHITIAKIVSQMDNAAAPHADRRLAVYPLGTADESLLSSLSLLLDKPAEKAELTLDDRSQQLIVVATDRQHALVKGTLEQLKRDEALVEVFPLRTVDPFAVETAIDRLYQDEVEKPVANGDTETQQLFVRGTKAQIDEIRQLLTKMGELPTQLPAQDGLRVVPFRGDLEQAIRQVKELWPQLRRNKLQVIPPPQAPSIESIESSTPANPQPDSESPNEKRLDQTTNSDRFETIVTAEEDDASERSVKDEAKPGTAKDDAEQEAPAILIIPGQGTVTLMSEDEEALNQAAALFSTLARRSDADSSAGNFAVLSLRNADARSIAKLLDDLFQKMPLTTRTILGKVSIVADDRLNALVIHGRTADRAVVTELLRVLDSSRVPDALANSRPTIVPLRYADAERVLSILEGVYATQLETGGSRPEISIPKGISSEVASVLEQINASVGGPLLTLQVDRVTNSLIVLAPRQLNEEVQSLIRQLDREAEQNDTRDIGVISLKSVNVEQIQDALEALLKP